MSDANMSFIVWSNLKQLELDKFAVECWLCCYSIIVPAGGQAVMRSSILLQFHNVIILLLMFTRLMEESDIMLLKRPTFN